MKTEQEIKDMDSFIAYFNDDKFLNPMFRRGVREAFSFVLYNWETDLDKFRKGIIVKDIKSP